MSFPEALNFVLTHKLSSRVEPPGVVLSAVPPMVTSQLEGLRNTSSGTDSLAPLQLSGGRSKARAVPACNGNASIRLIQSCAASPSAQSLSSSQDTRFAQRHQCKLALRTQHRS